MTKNIWAQTRIWQAIFKYKGIQVQINSEHKIKSLDINRVLTKNIQA